MSDLSRLTRDQLNQGFRDHRGIRPVPPEALVHVLLKTDPRGFDATRFRPQPAGRYTWRPEEEIVAFRIVSEADQ